MKIQVDFKLYGAEWCYKVYAKGTEAHKLTSFGHNLYDMIGKGYLVDNGAIYDRIWLK